MCCCVIGVEVRFVVMVWVVVCVDVFVLEVLVVVLV